MARLTSSPKQAETLQHIRQFIAEKGYSPTVAERVVKPTQPMPAGNRA